MNEQQAREMIDALNGIKAELKALGATLRLPLATNTDNKEMSLRVTGSVLTF